MKNISFTTRAIAFGLAFLLVIPSAAFFAGTMETTPFQIMDDGNTRSEPNENEITNSELTQVVQSGFDGGTPIWDMGIRGENQIVGLYDLGVDYDHEAFRNATNVADNAPGPTHRKMYAYHVIPGADDSDSGSFDHGTLNAGMIAADNTIVIGSNSGNVNGRGVAYKAKLSFVDGGDSADMVHSPSDWREIYQLIYDDGGRIMASAIGYNNNEYNSACAQTDLFTWNNQDFVGLFPAGSIGAPATVIPPGTAKNAISVGATLNGVDMDDMAGFSSQGPTTDNRLKPEIVVPGSDIMSSSSDFDLTTFNIGYDTTMGTGQAASIAAGATGLIKQYFEEGWYPTGTKEAANGFSPSGALMRAMLVNCADEMMGVDTHDSPYNGMAYPNCNQGWGRVNLDNALYFNGDSRVLSVIDHTNGLDGGDTIEYTIDLIDNTEPLEITLVWNDYPSPVDAPSLINNLDLEVTDISNAWQYKGNVFAGTPGLSVTGGAFDNLNTIENVLIGAPSGEYRITVTASSLSVGPQPFALVITGKVNQDYGLVTLDRTAYSDGDTIQVRVEDDNVVGGSLVVNIISDTEPAGEDLTLSETSPSVFTGSIDTMFFAPQTDGFLQVSHGDVITATYSDDAPVHDSIATATIDATGPVITNVRAFDIIGTAAKVTWDTDEMSNGTVYYGTSSDSSTWTLSAGSSEFRYSPLVQLQSLSTDTLYYYDVESSDLQGHVTKDTNGGQHYTFSTISSSAYNILLFDDDGGGLATDGTPFNEDWENMLIDLGWSYLYWEKNTMDTPALADLQQAKAVLWIVADGYPTLDASDMAVLADYLNAGGKLYIVGQDIGWDMCDPFSFDLIPGVTDVWYETYMKATYMGDDADGGLGNEAGDMEIQGLFAGDPISGDYLAGTDLDQASFGAGRFYPDDITASTDAGVEINWDYDNPGGGSAHEHFGNAASVRFEGTYPSGTAPAKMVYEAFAHEMLGTWNPPAIDPIRVDILNKTIIWLLGGNHPYLTLTSPVGGETFSTSPATITWSASSANTIDLYYSNNSGSAWQPVPGGIGLPGAQASFDWDLTSVPNGFNYRIKIVATGAASLMAMDESGSDFTIDRPGGDILGPATIPGSVVSDPLPVNRGSSVDVFGTVDDSARGNSDVNIVKPAECFIDTDPGIDNGIPMFIFDGLTSPTEVVNCTIDGTITSALSVGEHSIYVRGQDEFGNWGTVFEGRLHVYSGPPSISLLTPNAAEFIITTASFDIQWSATPGDNPLAADPIDIYYSSDGGNTWLEINGGTYSHTDDGQETWFPPFDDVNYLVRVEVTDTLLMSSSDTSSFVFSVDMVEDDEWFFQIEASGINKDLDMKPVELSSNIVSTGAIPGNGPIIVGTWETTNTFTSSSIDGPWSFNVYGYMSSPGATGRLFAEIFTSSDTVIPLDITINDDTDVTDSSALYTWTDTLAGVIQDGDSIIVEIWLDVTSGGGGSTVETLNPDFTTDASNWAYAGWEDTGGGSAVGSWNGGSGNPPGSVDIILTGATGGAAAENTYSGYWEQSFTTGFVPTAAELVLDWSCLGIGVGDSNMIAYAFVDTASGTPSLGTEIWSSGLITGTTGWASVGPIDVSGIVNADSTYYLKVAFRDTDLGKNEGTRTVGFDNVKVSWSSIAPVFYMEFDFADTKSSVAPSVGGGPPPITYDISVSLGWSFLSYPVTASGSVITVFDDNGGDTTWDRIYWWDPIDMADHWKSYNKNYPGTQDMPNVNNEMGFWINITDVGSDGFLSVLGNNPTGTVITLAIGWNLVGFPATVEGYTAGDLKTDSVGMVTRIEWYNDAAAYDIEPMPDGDAFQIGQAYWVYSTGFYPWFIP